MPVRKPLGSNFVPKGFLTGMVITNTEVLLLPVGEPFVPKGFLTGMAITEVLLLHTVGDKWFTNMKE
jgi:hypothetical protein